MKALVCGGRDYANYDAVVAALSKLPITNLIHGGARGADSLAGRYAREAGIPCKMFEAQWDLHGRSAGHVRNQRMLDEGKPNLVIAFPGGRGTADMVRRARAAGVAVSVVEEI